MSVPRPHKEFAIERRLHRLTGSQRRPRRLHRVPSGTTVLDRFGNSTFAGAIGYRLNDGAATASRGAELQTPELEAAAVPAALTPALSLGEKGRNVW